MVVKTKIIDKYANVFFLNNHLAGWDVTHFMLLSIKIQTHYIAYFEKLLEWGRSPKNVVKFLGYIKKRVYNKIDLWQIFRGIAQQQ